MGERRATWKSRLSSKSRESLIGRTQVEHRRQPSAAIAAAWAGSSLNPCSQAWWSLRQSNGTPKPDTPMPPRAARAASTPRSTTSLGEISTAAKPPMRAASAAASIVGAFTPMAPGLRDLTIARV